MKKYQIRTNKNKNNKTKGKKRKERKSKKISFTRAGLPNYPYTKPSNLNKPMSINNPPILAPGYVEHVGTITSNEHCTYITTPTGTYSHATIGTPTVRYHYGFRKFRNGNVVGPLLWSNPANQPIPENILKRLLDIYTHCSNQ